MTHKAAPLRAVVVDDSGATRRILTRMLEDTDIEVVAEADDVEPAIDACRREAPDLLFLDVVMPGGSGVDVLRKVKDILPAVRVLMITSIDERDTVASCRDLGASGYILKPFSRDKVLAGVRRLCAEIQGDTPEKQNGEAK